MKKLNLVRFVLTVATLFFATMVVFDFSPLLYDKFGDNPIINFAKVLSNTILSSDFGNSGSLVLLVLTYTALFLSFLNWNKLFRKQKLMSLVLWPLYPIFINSGFNKEEARSSAEFAVTGAGITGLSIFLFLVHFFKFMN